MMMAPTKATSPLGSQFISHLTTRPNAPAVITDAGPVTFAALGGLVAATQQVLADTRTRIVGLYSSPSVPLVAAAWAALCSGVPYVPLSLNYPDERLRFMVTNAGVDTVIAPADVHGDLHAIIGDLNVRILDIPSVPLAGSPQVAASADSLGYILYTSGSTGTPKGVEVSHEALAHQMGWLRDGCVGLTASARIIHKTPISFDASQWELLANATGATVVVGTPDAYRDPQALIESITAHGVTHLQAVPTLLQALCEDEDFSRCTSLEVVASGGEVLTVRLATTIQSLLPQASVINLYGPTETTINASFHVFDPAASTQGGDPAVPIGSPVHGLRFFLLDPEGTPSPNASMGELAIAGPQVAMGYHDRPEETQRRFVDTIVDGRPVRYYRTGDVVEVQDGVYVFRGRADSQVKVRGHRIELGEVRTAIENHEWVRHAEVLTSHGAGGTANRMVAFVELNPQEAALMDQGVHGQHHQSKVSRTQVRAQVAGLGVRDDIEGPMVPLPITWGDNEDLRHLAFARKTYRNFHSTTTDLCLLRSLLHLVKQPREWPLRDGTWGENPWSMHPLGLLLRSLVGYHSEDRVLPKYAYASPGALYGVQVYVVATGVEGLPGGTYYLSPRLAALQRVGDAPAASDPGVELVLVGKRPVITSVYQTNVDEVLLFEAGHLLGLLDTVAPAAGLRVGRRHDATAAATRAGIDADEDTLIIGAWPLMDAREHGVDGLDGVECKLELLRGDPATRGVYANEDAGLVRVSEAGWVRRRDVIAINQRVYDQASFGVILCGDGSRGSYIDLARALQRVELNDLNLGLMSSGYSSFTDRDLATARRIKAATGSASQSSYFAVGGPITDDQITHCGMDEDVLHMQGPAEIIAADIAQTLPHYMVPDTIRILDSLPRTPNGKVDGRALQIEAEAVPAVSHDYVAPASLLEDQLAQMWREVLEADAPVSVADSFFALGGSSITAVRLVKTIRDRLAVRMPIQAVFEHDTIAKQAQAIQADQPAEFSRVVPLAGLGDEALFMWPGLGGYPMNLRRLAEGIAGDRYRCYGVQAYGLNEDEFPDSSIQSMAARDVEALRKVAPAGPYTLLGYSFGARVAFEAACQLEAAGETVECVVLLAPGSPKVSNDQPTPGGLGRYADPRFTRVLYSVFFTRTDGQHADQVVAAGLDHEAFLEAIVDDLPFDRALAERIIALVEATYSCTYAFEALDQGTVQAQTVILRADGDDYSFLDRAKCHAPLRSITLGADHYQILQAPHVNSTAETVSQVLAQPIPAIHRKDRVVMPHVLIQHFPMAVSDDAKQRLVAEVASLVSETFHVDDAAISIDLEPVSPEDWMHYVYTPRILSNGGRLAKSPGYGPLTAEGASS